MKKFFTLIVATVMAASANAQTSLPIAGDGWRCDFSTAAPSVTATYNFKNAYACVKLNTEAFNVADYPSYELVLADDAPITNLQFNVNYDTADESAKNGWSGAFTSATPSAFVPTGATKINYIQIQACNVENLGNVTIKSFYLIDKDGNKVATTFNQPEGWNAPIVATSGTATWKDGQWGSLLATVPANLSNQKITVNSETEFPTEVLNLVVKTTEHPNGLYEQLTPGEKVHSRDIAASEGTITYIAIQFGGNASSLPISLNISSITVQDITPTAMSTTTTTVSGKAVKAIKNGRIVISANGAEYNVAGQLEK